MPSWSWKAVCTTTCFKSHADDFLDAGWAFMVIPNSRKPQHQVMPGFARWWMDSRGEASKRRPVPWPRDRWRGRQWYSRSRKRMKFGNNILEYLAAYQSQIMNGSNDTIQGAFGARRLCKRRTTWSAVHMGSGSRSRLRRPNDGHSRSIQTELFQLRFDDRWLQCYPCSKPGHKKQLHWLMRGGDGPSYHKKNQTNFVSLARSRNGRMSIEGDGG